MERAGLSLSNYQLKKYIFRKIVDV